MSGAGPWCFAAAAALLLLLAWWGWQQGGLALMQLGMSIC